MKKVIVLKKNNKDITKRVRLTENECRKIMKEAKKKNMNFSAYVRYAAKLDKNMDPEFIKAIYKLANEINYIGHNINQVVKNNNSKLYSEIDKARFCLLSVLPYISLVVRIHSYAFSTIQLTAPT